MRCLDRGRLRSRRNGKGDGISHARHGRELDRNKALRGTDIVALLVRLQIRLVLLLVRLGGLDLRIRELVQRRVVVEDGRDARVRTVVRIGDLIVALIIDVSGACRRDRVLIDARGRQSSGRNVAAAANMTVESFGLKRRIAEGRCPLCRRRSHLTGAGRAVHGLPRRGLGGGRAERSFEGERSDDRGRVRRAACQIGRRYFDRCEGFLVEAAA